MTSETIKSQIDALMRCAVESRKRKMMETAELLRAACIVLDIAWRKAEAEDKR